MRFDLSKFKKTHEDATHATLLHPHGHQIRIAKAGLDAKLKKQLAELPAHMADGGEIEDLSREPAADKKKPKQEEELSAEAQADVDARLQQLYIQREKEREQIRREMQQQQGRQPQSDMGIDQVDLQGAPVAADEERGLAGKYAKIAGQPDPEFDQNATQAPNPQEIIPNTGNIALPKPKAQPKQSGMPQPPDMSKQMLGAYQGMQQAAQNYGQAMGEAANAQADIAKDVGLQWQDFQRFSQDVVNRQLGDLDATVADIKASHIRPDAFWADKSVPGKVASIMGLILGGIGGGLTGQENPALKFLNAQIDNNLRAQVENARNKNNIFSAYLHKFGSVQAALAMTKGAMLAKQAADFEEAGARAVAPIEKEKASLLANQYKIQAIQTVAPMLYKQAMLEYMNQGHNIDPGLQVRVLMDGAPESEKTAAFKEVEKAKETEELRKSMFDTWDHLHQLSLNGMFSPKDRASAVNLLGGKIQHLAEGRFNLEASNALADAMLPGRADTDETAKTKLKRIDVFFDSMRNEAVTPAYGIKLPKYVRPNVERMNVPKYRK